MIYKIEQIFIRVSSSTNYEIKNKEQLDYLIKKLLDRKIIIEHDIILLNKYILDFPINFEQFISLIRQIYKLDIEQQLESKVLSYEESFSRILKFLNFYSYSNLNTDDLSKILSNLNVNIENIKTSLKKINKIDFLLKNIRDDIHNILWNKIDHNIINQNENENPDFFIEDAKEYQLKMKTTIDYEYAIIRTKKINFTSLNNVKKQKKITMEIAYCADRNIPIQVWKFSSNYFDHKILSKFYNKCEALKELLLSKYFQKFLGYDDLSNDNYQLFFFENIEGKELNTLIKSLDLDLTESSILFKYLAKEILTGLRDLLYKSTYSFKFPITIANIYYHLSQQRLYFLNVEFTRIRKTIIESHKLIEAKLLYSYGLILINLLAFSNQELNELINFINSLSHSLSHDFKEFDNMQILFDHIFYIEEILTKNLENDVIISIIIECLITPYKAKLVFDEFYRKKNFLQEVLNEEKSNTVNSKSKENDKLSTDIKIENNCSDNYVAFQPYYKNDANSSKKNAEDVFLKNDSFISNESLPDKIMTLNLLLIHPFYNNTTFDSSFVSFLFKN